MVTNEHFCRTCRSWHANASLWQSCFPPEPEQSSIQLSNPQAGVRPYLRKQGGHVGEGHGLLSARSPISFAPVSHPVRWQEVAWPAVTPHQKSRHPLILKDLLNHRPCRSRQYSSMAFIRSMLNTICVLFPQPVGIGPEWSLPV